MTIRTFLRRAGLVAAGLVIGTSVALWYFIKLSEARFVEQWSPLLAEQTNVLKFLRANRQPQIQSMLEAAVWSQIAAHAQRMAEGKAPPENSKREIAYHCAYNAEHAAAVDPKVVAERAKWCAVLEAK